MEREGERDGWMDGGREGGREGGRGRERDCHNLQNGMLEQA